MSTKVNGSVKNWLDNKGYGFITGDDGKDYFVHRTSITKGRTSVKLAPGDKVEFTPTSNNRGVCADDVVLTEAAKRNTNNSDNKD